MVSILHHGQFAVQAMIQVRTSCVQSPRHISRQSHGKQNVHDRTMRWSAVRPCLGARTRSARSNLAMRLRAQTHLDRSDVLKDSPLLESLRQADLRTAVGQINLSA